MGRLKGQITYLAGPIEFANDKGVGWRQYITPKLKKFGIGILNPIDKEVIYQFHEDSTFHALKKKLIDEKKYDEYSLLMKQVARSDLRMVDKSDFLIAYVDIDIHMCGTYHEIIMCAIERKPCLLVCKQGKQYTPPWLWGILPHEYFFSTFDEVLKYLKKIDRSKGYIDKWLFFDMEKVYGK